MVELNYISVAFSAVYCLQWIWALWLERINLRHMERFGRTVPEGFEEFVDPHKLERINRYTADNGTFRMYRKTVINSVLLAIILFGGLTSVDALLSRMGLSAVFTGVLFYCVVAAFFSLLALPWDWYHTFVIEEKHGFNRSTLKLWIMDRAKASLISLVLLAALSAAVLWAIHSYPRWWWLIGFVIVSLVQLCLTVLYPVLIAPLFNRFDPLQDELLTRRVEDLIGSVGMKSGGVFQMDAGRRSAHANAYFAGLGKTKRVVLFDTLIETNTHDEILAVLAHELGHFKLRHILKEYLLSQAMLVAGFYLAYLVVGWERFAATFGFTAAQPHAVLLLTGILFVRSGYWIEPFFMAVSRHFERQADAFAAKLMGTAAPLIAALKNIAGQNLSNLSPHALYVRFRYSHPPLTERIRLLKAEGAAVSRREEMSDARAANM